MKSTLLRAVVLSCIFLLGWSYDGASAATSWTSKCEKIYGKVEPNQNPAPQQINCLLTNAALAAKIPPEVVKAIAEQENGWKQFTNGEPFISKDGGIGLMQLTNQANYDPQKLKTDIYYNIQAGVEILNSMYNRTDLPKIKGAGREVIENWYFPVMAYNGTKPINSPLFQDTGKRNANAYQEKIFSILKRDSFLDDTTLAQFPFKTKDFDYDPNSSKNIVFKVREYTITGEMHPSNYYFQTGDKVIVTADKVKVRSDNSSASSVKKELAKNTTLIITGNFTFDKSSTSNRFVWYPVKTTDAKVIGFVSSAYISRKLDAPVVNIVDDNDKSISGKAPANARIQIKNGTKVIGSAVADKNKNFKADIPVQKAGTKLTISYKDQYNAASPAKTIIVADKTAPAIPTVKTVTNRSTAVSGKTEAYAAVTVTISTKSYKGKADKYGNYKVAIPVQNFGKTITVTARDKAGNKSKAKVIKVVRTAPNMPTVNKLTYKTATVTGKAEKNAAVSIKIGKKTYSAKASASGSFKVRIPKQRAGTKLYVNAKDSKGKVSATRTVAVSK